MTDKPFHDGNYTAEEQELIKFVIARVDENLKMNEVPFPIAVPAIMILCANYCCACFNSIDEIVEEFRKTCLDVKTQGTTEQ